ncbi:protein LNK1-like [Olea europaea var. sylvestris]|uniref:protein LNK1-like n=1 Tax=Olea europaea var. sylvestris TaxID=158386 RepID=UPI000C1CF31C|nr:protein LNK1-like [Olea europaea var. sylvestris]
MSDLCTYKIEGTVWDEFCQIDDHIVPQSGDKRVNRISFHGDVFKKPRCEVTCISGNSIDRYNDRYVDNERDGGEHNRRSSMLEKYSSSHKQNSLFPTSSDSDSISYNAKTSGHDIKNNHTDSTGSEFCANDPIHDEKSTADHSHSYSYPLGDTPQIDNDPNFFDNFEDVDRMFRSCDSTYGLGASREDEFGWFSSPNALGESRDVPKSELKLSYPESNAMENISENHDLSKLIVTCAINDSALATSPVGSKKSSWPLGRDEFASHLSNVKGPSSSDRKDEFTPRDQFDECKMLSKHHDLSERKGTEQYLGNGSSFSNLPGEVIQFPDRDTSHQAFPYVDVQYQQQAMGQDSYHAACDSVSLEKQVHLSGDKQDNHCDVEGVRIGTPAELCSSDVQESLSTSSDLDDISAEAVSFHQLHHVTEQLNLKTRLCIRDGLCRLALLAEQRQQLENPNSSYGDQRDASGTFMAECAKKCTGVINMEVDRSIAQLLFTCP